MKKIEKKIKELEYEINLVLNDLNLEKDQTTGITVRLNELKDLVNPLPRYLVRPHDVHIFELDKSNNCYRSYSTRQVTYADGTRAAALSHMTYDNLTENYDFFPITEKILPDYEKKHQLYMDYSMWRSRSDGHGGVKGGTYEEFLLTR